MVVGHNGGEDLRAAGDEAGHLEARDRRAADRPALRRERPRRAVQVRGAPARAPASAHPAQGPPLRRDAQGTRSTGDQGLLYTSIHTKLIISNRLSLA